MHAYPVIRAAHFPCHHLKISYNLIVYFVSSSGGLGGKRTTMFTQVVNYMNLREIESRLGHKIWSLMHPLFMSTDVCYKGV